MYTFNCASHVAHWHAIQFVNRIQHKLGSGCGEGFIMAAALVCWDEMI